MNISRRMMLVSLITVLTACDMTDPIDQPEEEFRTMIIGGVPVHERDYKIPEMNISAQNFSHEQTPD